MDCRVALAEESRQSSDAQQSQGLPNSWTWTTLGTVLPIQYGKALPERIRNQQGRVPVFGSSGRVGLHDEAIAPGNSLIVGRKGSAGSVHFAEAPCWPIDTAYFSAGTSAIEIRYGYWYLQLHQLGRFDQSTAIPSLSRDRYDVQPIPLAPLAEQRRIVARIDALFAEIAEGEAALAAARDGVDIFRRALVKAAVTGELSADWRAANTVSETGGDLIARVARHRTTAATGRRSRRSAETRVLDAVAHRELPEEWTWASLEDLGEIVGGATVDQKRKPTDPVTAPYLRVANVQRGNIDLSEVKTITVERSAAERLRLRRGDVLLNEGGDRDKIGRGWVWDGSVPDMIHQNHVFRVRLHDDGINPYFVSHYANELGRRFFIEQGKQTTNLASISLSRIGTLPVPVPSPAESVEIVRRVSEALSACADTLATLDAEAADVARLKQSVLKAAFEGRLVPQDSAEEPAAALLERLATTAPAPTRAKRGRSARSHA